MNNTTDIINNKTEAVPVNVATDGFQGKQRKKKGFFSLLYLKVTRKKKVGYDTDRVPPGTRGFGRGLLSITATGVSNTIGSALYILTGFVMRYKAGPAIIISYLIASITTFCSALMYSELVGQISAHGSDYLYSYVTMGELYGFMVGWNLILEYCVDVASVSKALTIHVDVIFFDSMINKWQQQTIGIPKSYSFSNSVDFFSVAFCLILTLIVAMGWKFSSVVNNFFTCFNLVCFVSIIVFGSFVADMSYWYEEQGPVNDTSCFSKHYKLDSNSSQKEDQITGIGFAPDGIHGAIRGAGSCIFAFAGFRAILTDGVKTKNPKRNLPLAALSTLAISTVLYMGVTFTISCMIPYWKIDTEAPITSTFCEHRLTPLKHMLAIGAISGLIQASVYKFLPLPPLLTVMSEDGLLFKFLGEVDKETRGPFKGTVSYGIVIMTFVAFFFLEELIDMLSIGTLIAYIMAAVAVIRLRYRPLPHYSLYTKVSDKTEKKVKISLVMYIVTVMVFGLLIAYLPHKTVLFVIIASALSIVLVTCAVIIYVQPQYINNVPFNCPWIPIMPLFSILVNGVLMMHLSYQTWIRFSVWMTVGVIVYFSYSIKNSMLSEGKQAVANHESSGSYQRSYSNPQTSSKSKYKKQNSEPLSRRNRVGRKTHLAAPDSRTRSRSTPGRATEAEERAARLFEWTAQLRAMKPVDDEPTIAPAAAISEPDSTVAAITNDDAPLTGDNDRDTVAEIISAPGIAPSDSSSSDTNNNNAYNDSTIDNDNSKNNDVNPHLIVYNNASTDLHSNVSDTVDRNYPGDTNNPINDSIPIDIHMGSDNPLVDDSTKGSIPRDDDGNNIRYGNHQPTVGNDEEKGGPIAPTDTNTTKSPEYDRHDHVIGGADKPLPPPILVTPISRGSDDEI